MAGPIPRRVHTVETMDADPFPRLFAHIDKLSKTFNI